MSYSLESASEAERLEKQVFQKNYNLEHELQRFSFDSSKKILDAGCGTGVLSRFLFENYDIKQIDGIDSSDERLAQANELLSEDQSQAIHFFQQDICHIDSKFHNQYTTIIARYVLEHLNDPQKALEELKNCLSEGGKLIILELDGVFFNLYSPNKKLNQYFAEIKEKFKFDLFIGRRIPNMLKDLDFKKITWNCELIECQKERLDEEYQNNLDRFRCFENFLTDLLQSKERFKEFRQLYLSEMQKPTNTMVFTKYYCSAIK